MYVKNGCKDLKRYPQISRRVRDTLARLYLYGRGADQPPRSPQGRARLSFPLPAMLAALAVAVVAAMAQQPCQNTSANFTSCSTFTFKMQCMAADNPCARPPLLPNGVARKCVPGQVACPDTVPHPRVRSVPHPRAAGAAATGARAARRAAASATPPPARRRRPSARRPPPGHSPSRTTTSCRTASPCTSGPAASTTPGCVAAAATGRSHAPAMQARPAANLRLLPALKKLESRF